MSFAMWSLAFYCSPCYFMVRGKWRACILNSVFYGLAVVLLISLSGAIRVPVFSPAFAPLFWFSTAARFTTTAITSLAWSSGFHAGWSEKF